MACILIAVSIWWRTKTELIITASFEIPIWPVGWPGAASSVIRAYSEGFLFHGVLLPRSRQLRGIAVKITFTLPPYEATVRGFNLSREDRSGPDFSQNFTLTFSIKSCRAHAA